MTCCYTHKEVQGRSVGVSRKKGGVRVDGAELTICLKTLESLVLEKDLSGTQRGIRPSEELALARCILAIMAFSSFCKGNLAQ